MSHPPVADDDILDHLEQLIAASEARTSAQTTALLALAKSGYETSEAEEALRRSMDILLTLRRQQLQALDMLLDDAGDARRQPGDRLDPWRL
jgi:hypothetical protein